ncbi:MAG: vitamin K epoxide reductase family protein [Patescibacteria group bacterium]|nr:vitamin K epoxide reductase family protein [Patescibacteria group bacterium]
MIFLVIAVVGFADAGYLTIEHYKNAIPPCSITGGCELVLTSAYATVLGIPVALLGAAYYFLVAAGAFAYLESKKDAPFRLSCALVMIGFLVSLWFFCLQAFVIHSYCTYCLGSAAMTTILFILTVIILSKYSGQGASDDAIHGPGGASSEVNHV